MKKTISKLLLLSILCVPFMAKADMGGPAIRDYEAIITTDRGVVCKNGKKKVILNQGDHIKVYGSVDSDGRIDYYVSSIDDLECDIKTGEFIPFEEEVRPTADNVYDTNRNIKIITNAEIVIRKGPDDLYNEVGKIPKGAIINYRYQSKTEGGASFVYIEYNGLKGWIKTHTRDITEYLEEIDDYNRFIAAFDTTTKCGVIPRNTIIAATKRYGNGETILNYNNCEFDYDYEKHSSLVRMLTVFDGRFTKEANIYEFADRKSKVLGKVDKNATPKVFSTYWDTSTDNYRLTLIYTEYKGIRGWVFLDDADVKYNDDEEPTMSTTITTAAIKERTTKKPKPLRAKKNNNMVIICSIVAGCLALTALVVIIILNKKKKGKAEKEEVKTEDTIKEVKIEETEETSEEKTEDDKSEKTEPEETKEDTE